MSELAREAEQARATPTAAAYLKAVPNLPFVRELTGQRLELEWAPTRLVSDDPAKGLGRAAPQSSVPSKLAGIIGRPERNVELVSAYFMPTAAGLESFAALAERGVSIRILTNSLEATDVAIVHAGYVKRRKALLEAGIRLYEMRRLSPRSEPGRACADWAGCAPECGSFRCCRSKACCDHLPAWAGAPQVRALSG